MKPDGRLVLSAHHYGLRARLKRTPRSGYYEGHQIYRYLSGRRELADEVGVWFKDVSCRPISVLLPSERKLRLPVSVSLSLARVPILNLLGELLLVSAERPRTFN
jgi:hypothetical protein